MKKPAQPYNAMAKRRWKKAEWIDGEGPYAVLAHCRVLSISLHETQEAAEKSKQAIDRYGCGGDCSPAYHHIVKMRAPRVTQNG